MNVLAVLKDRFRQVLAALAGDPDSLVEMVRPSQDARFGDYQANCAMPLGKKLKRPPREIAEEISRQVQLADVCQPPEVAGPGFINLRLKNDWLVRQLEYARRNDRLGIEPTSSPLTYVVDFSSPNVAKPMHVGHIRSTVIGDALCRTLRFMGHHVIGDNHLGDWGTQFGMIIYGYRHFVDPAAFAKQPLQELGRLYQRVRQLMDIQSDQQQLPKLEADVARLDEDLKARAHEPVPTDPKQAKSAKKALAKLKTQVSDARSRLDDVRSRLDSVSQDPELRKTLQQHPDVEAAVLQETAKLHEGDAENRRLWNEFLPKCKLAIQSVYDRLNVSFDQELGESFYHDRLQEVVDTLKTKQLASESDGAICVFLDGYQTPMIIQKKDGAFLYATSDLATIQYRMETWHPDVILYVVDFRQGEHFGKLFDVARLCEYSDVELRHISFGTVLGEDGRPFKTRSGDTVGLEGLLDEAERKAYEVVCASDDAKPNGPEINEQQRRHIAKVVGIAALKYADLSQNRTSDYVFSYDKMLALNGNTATYMQYSYARVHGIFARGEVDAEQLRGSTSAAINLDHPAERALGLHLVRFSEAIDETLADYRPNHLTNYLFELAKSYSTFFEQCPVLRADNKQQRNSRLLLCDLTARTLKQGLSLLGIDVIEKM